MRSQARLIGWVAGFAVISFLPDPAAAQIPRYQHSSTVLPDGNILVCGGNDAAGNSIVNSCQLYITTAHFFMAGIPFGSGGDVPRSSHTTTVLPDGKVLFAGGEQVSGCPACVRATLDRGDIYDPLTRTFPANVTLTGGARADHTATLLTNGKVLVAGGRDAAGNSRGDGQLFTTGSPGSWAPLVSMPANNERMFHTATPLHNGLVFITGGYRTQGGVPPCNNYLQSSLFFDPTTGLFLPAPPLGTCRAYHAATYIRDRKVVIAGGQNGIDDSLTRPRGFLRTTEIYDAVLNNVIFGPQLQMYVSGPTATTSPEGGASLYGGLGTPGLLRLDNRSIFLKTSGFAHSIQFADMNVPGPLFREDIDGGSIQLQNVQVTILPGLNGYILDGYIDISSATMTVSSGTLVFISSNPQLDGNTPPPNYMPALRASLNNMIVAAGELLDPATGLSPDLVFTINRISSASIVSASTLPFQDTDGLMGNPDSKDIDRELLALKNINIVTSSVTINAMVFSFSDYLAFPIGPWTFARDFGTSSARTNHTTTLMPGGDRFIIGGRRPTPAPVLFGSVGYLMTDGFWQAGVTLKNPRSNHTLSVLGDGRPMAVGGSNGPSVLNSSELFNPISQTWDLTSQVMYDARNQHTANVLPNGRLLVAGGFSTNAVSTGATANCEVYDPTTDRWYRTGPLADTRYNHTATLLSDGNVLVTGGFTGSSYLGSTEIYYSTAGVWRTVGALTTGRALHTANLLQDGRVLVAGGTNGLPQLTSEIFDPATNSWSAGPPMAFARHSHSGTTLAGGSIVVIAGNNGAGEFSNAEIYTPTNHPRPNGVGVCGAGAGCWDSPDVPFASTRSYASYAHNATLLPNGYIYLTGGDSVTRGVLRETEVFDNDLSTFTIQGNMSTRRKFHAAAMIPNGNVLVTGGTDGGSTFSSTELTQYTFEPDARRPIISSVTPSSLDRGQSITVTGTQFTGLHGPTSSGYGYAGSADWMPRLTLQAVESSGGVGSQHSGGYLIDLSSRIYQHPFNPWSNMASSITFTLPTSALPYGWYQLRVHSGATASISRRVQIGPPIPAGTPGTINANILGISSITFNWSTGTLIAASFNAYETVGSTSGIILQSTVPAVLGPTFVTSFTVTGLSPNTTASISVAGYNLSGPGPLQHSATVYTFAAVPASLVFSSVAADGLFLEWSGSSNAFGTVYEVSQSTDDFITSFSTPVPASLTYTSTSTFINSLAAATTFFFRVKAFNTPGSPTAFSLSASTRTLDPVLPVLSLSTRTADSVALIWTVIPNSTSTVYEVSQSTDAFATAFSTPVPASLAFATTSTVIGGLVPNLAHSFRVRAFLGSTPGGFSNVATTTTLLPTVPFLSVSSVTSNSVSLQWPGTFNSTNTIFEVSQSTNAFATDFSTPVPVSMSLATTGTVVTNLTENILYSFRVRSFVTGIPGGFSNVVSTTTRLLVANVSGQAISATRIDWTWDPTTGATSYRVYLAATGALLGNPASNSFSDVNLSTNTRRGIQVTAISAAGEGPLSASATVFTLAAAPLAPAGSPFVNLSTGGFRAFWFDGGNPTPPNTLYNAVFEQTSNGAQVFSSTATTLLADLAGQLPNTEIRARVRAINGDSIPTAPYVNLGSTATLANGPSGIAAIVNTSSELRIVWGTNNNPSYTIWEVNLTSVSFTPALSVSTPVPFSDGFTASTVSLTGLISGTTYFVRVTAQSLYGAPSASVIFSTVVSNGGSPLGTLLVQTIPENNVVVGGTIGSPAGGTPREVAVIVPANSFDNPVALLLSTQPAVAACASAGLNVAFTIAPTPPSQPRTPIIVGIGIAAAEPGVTNTATLAVTRHDPVSNACVPLKTTYDPVTRRVYAQINHLSTFVLTQLNPASNIDGARAFPNPLYISNQGFMTFDRLPAGARVRLYTLHGELLFDEAANNSGLLTWPGTNKSHRRVGSGVYLAVIESGGQKQIIKVAVIK